MDKNEKMSDFIEGLRVAMLGTTDGDFIDPDSDIPAGEMFRLAAEYIQDFTRWEIGVLFEGEHEIPIPFATREQAQWCIDNNPGFKLRSILRRRAAGAWEEMA